MVSDVYLRFRYVDRQCKFHVPRVCRKRLVPSVCEECYQREYLSRTWVASTEGQLRFDMMYTAPALQKIASTIRNLVDASALSFLKSGNTPRISSRCLLSL